MLHRRPDKATVVEPLTAIIQTMTKPSSLITAEERLAEARVSRESKAQAHTAACRAVRDDPSALNFPPASVFRLQSDLAKADEEVRAAREQLRLARENFAPSFHSTVETATVSAMDELALIADRARTITDSLVRAQDFIARNGIAAEGPLARALYLRESVTNLQRIVGVR
jgi:hypothetical protein